MLDIYIVVGKIIMVLFILVPGIFYYVDSMRVNVREKDAKKAFSDTLLLVCVLVLSILVFKYYGAFHAFDVIKAIFDAILRMGFNVIEFGHQ